MKQLTGQNDIEPGEWLAGRFPRQLEVTLAHLEKLQQQVNQLPVIPPALSQSLAELADNLARLQINSQEIYIRSSSDLNGYPQIEEALAEERNMLRTLIDNVPDYVYFKDSESRFVTGNQAVAWVMGAGSVDELIGKTDFDFYPTALATRYYSDEQVIFRTGQSLVNQEEPHIDAQGQLRWILTTKVPLRDSQQRIVGLVGVGRDITDLKQAQEALRESEALNRTVLNSLTAHIAVVDKKGVIMVVNEAWERFARQQGVKGAGQIGVGVNYLEACGSRGGKAARQGIEAVLRGSQDRFIMEYAHHTPDREIWFLMTVTPLSERRGGAVISHLDISERKQMEAALQRERDFAESLIETAPMLVLVLDMDGRIVRYNSYTEEILGYPLAEVQGQDWFEICFPERARPAIRDLFLRAVKTDIYIRGHINPIITREGQIREIEWSGKTLRGSDGQIIGLLTVGQDITERWQAEVEKAQLLEAVTEQREQLRALTGRLAEARELERKELARELHDQVGQKLTALNLNLNIIETQLPTEVASDHSTVQRCLADSLILVEQTTECIQDLMANLRPPVLDDYGLVAALRWYGNQFARRVNFTITVQGEEPRPRLSGPVEHALFRITQEALTNVAKHAQASQVLIVLITEKERVRLTISDDGCGFEVNEWSSPTGRQHWGLLTMTERAEVIGGHCRISSQPGRGTQIFVEVPR
jgi:PAS domain S-box-containing protein